MTPSVYNHFTLFQLSVLCRTKTLKRWICQLALALKRKCLVLESFFSVQDDWSQVSVPLGAVEVVADDAFR